jgi:hypothetical protein
LSVGAGILTLLTLTGRLERADGEPSIYTGNIRLFSMAQVLSFAVAFALTIVFGFKAV